MRLPIGLAALGVVLVGLALAAVANRTFVDRPVRGGLLIEAATGRPVVLSPLFATSDIEVDLARLLFAGLTRPDPRTGIPTADLAERWQILEEGRRYRFRLRAGLTWHDGAPLTADDVVFTAELASNPRLRGTLSRAAAAWSEVRADKVDQHQVDLVLQEPYAPFLATTYLGILPRHLLADVPAAEVSQSRHSTLEPVGAGPYQLAAPGGLDETGIRLRRFDGHWAATERQPYLQDLAFQFTPSPESALEAFGRRTVMALGGLPAAALEAAGPSVATYSATQAGFTLIYLNHRQVPFRDVAVRRAMSIAIDRGALVADPDLLNGQGIPATGPVPRGAWAYDDSLSPPGFDADEAERVLDAAGWIDGDGNGVRDKDGKSLSITLGVGGDPVLVRVAERVRSAWTAIGIEVTVRPTDDQRVISELSERSYDAMLFTWTLRSYDPDPFPLWHSSQITDGQNFSAWSHAGADALLETARKDSDVGRRTTAYREFQRLFALEQPALVLWYPLYSYAVLEGEVGGVQLPQLVVDPADRFLTGPDWYVETERVFLERP